MRRDELVRIAVALPFFAVYLTLELTCAGLRWLSDRTLAAFQAIAGE